MNLWGGVMQNYDQALARAQQEQQRNALAQMGANPYFIGMEGDETTLPVERPQWLKAVYESGDPNLALKAEQLAAAPYQLDRDVAKTSKLESAKLAEKLKYETALRQKQMQDFQGMYHSMMGGGGSNVFANQPAQPQGQVAASFDGMLSPGNGVMAPPSNLGGLSTMKPIMRYSAEHGPSIEMQPEYSPLGAELEKVKSRQSEDKLGIDREASAREASKQAAELRKQADDRVLSIKKEMDDTRKLRSSGTVNPADIDFRMNELKDELSAAKSYRESVYSGKDAPPQAASSATLTPQEMKQVESAKSSRLQPQGKSAGAPAGPDIGAGLPYKQKMELQQKSAEQKVQLANKTLQDIQTGAGQSAEFNSTVGRMRDMLDKEDIGNRFMGNLPFGVGEPLQRMFSQSNDEFQRLRNYMINSMKREGESKSYDTIPELKIVASAIPGIDASPDTNRRFVAEMSNLMDARQAAPDFFENWSKQHGGSIDGARTAFTEWMKYNKPYAVEDINGRTKVKQVENVIPPGAWTRLRQRLPANEIVKKRDAGHIQVINGRVFLKE